MSVGTEAPPEPGAGYFGSPSTATGPMRLRISQWGIILRIFRRKFAQSQQASDPACGSGLVIEIDDDAEDAEYTITRTTNSAEPLNTGFNPARFLDSTYSLSAIGQDRIAVDWIIDQIDDMLNDGQFTDCNKIFSVADPNRLCDSLIVTFLGITIAAKNTLPSRNKFYMRALPVVAERRGEEGAEKLLGKYR